MPEILRHRRQFFLLDYECMNYLISLCSIHATTYCAWAVAEQKNKNKKIKKKY